MSIECQVLGAELCEIGKTCPNENCDYRICNRCAEKILENSEEEIFNTFKCPACTRPVTYSFNGPKLIYKMKRCFLSFYKTIVQIIMMVSFIWSILCWGRLCTMFLHYIGFWGASDLTFFNEQFFIYAIMGWLLFVFFILCVIIAISIITGLVGFGYILYELLYLAGMGECHRTILID